MSGRISAVGLLLAVMLCCLGVVQAAPLVGNLTPANAIVGGNAGDKIGDQAVVELPNRNVVIISPNWNGGRGAVTCLTRAQYKAGNIVVSEANSLVGAAPGNRIGSNNLQVLDNGHYVVVSTEWDNGALTDVGAVTWVNGETCIPHGESTINAVVSPVNSLVGSMMNDHVGSYGITKLIGGNYVVVSPEWMNRTGAVTWGNGATGIAGVVSASNSLVGSQADDSIGSSGVRFLENGHYVVSSPDWNNGGVVDAGAVTWGNGTTGIIGAVSTTNSLVGSTTEDEVGYYGVAELDNGNFVVISPFWNNGAATDAGAVTWGNGMMPLIGTVSAANSLVGTTTDDEVGSYGIYVLTGNGHYTVHSPYWNNGSVMDAGAVTWGNGTTGVSGPVSAGNSLVGSSTDDRIGYYGLYTLENGGFVLPAPEWDNGSAIDAGAVLSSNGTAPITGTINASNALIGTTAFDRVSYGGVVELENGNYVINSYTWNDSIGAVTWVNASTGIVGTISAANSLVGTISGDTIGSGSITALSNGNYVVSSYGWDNGSVVDAGAATWGNGASGVVGVVSAANSLVGSSMDDQVGASITELQNGHYVVENDFWDNGLVADVGAATWGNGLTGITGPVSAANSLIGSTAGDQVGSFITNLENGNYVVRSPFWDNGLVADVGAATWGNGETGIVGVVSSSNSLVGSTAGDRVSTTGVTRTPQGHYFVRSNFWDNGTAVDAGAVTWGNGFTGISGVVSPVNSLVGSITNDRVGSGVFRRLANNHYALGFPEWDNGSAANAGAVIWVNTDTGAAGTLSAANAIVGSTTGDAVGSQIAALSNGGFLVRSSLWDNGVIVDAGVVAYSDGGGVILNLVSNGGFELLSVDKPSQPDVWTGKTLSKDRLKCNTLTVTFSYNGLCAFRFLGSATENARLTQLIINPADLTAGSTLNGSLYYKTNKIKPKLKVKVKIFYAGVTLPETMKGTITVKAKDAYQVFNLPPHIVQPGTVERIKVQFQNKALAGKIYIDDVSLNFLFSRR